MRTHQMICRSIGGPLTATVYYCSRRLMNESRGSARQVSSRILTQTKGIRSGTNPAWIFHSTVEGQRTLDLEHAQIFWKWLVDDVDGGYSAVISQGFKKKIGPSPSKKGFPWTWSKSKTTCPVHLRWSQQLIKASAMTIQWFFHGFLAS
jgi:hypothetical protein